MKETGDVDQRSLSGKSRWTLFRILMFAGAGSVVFAVVVVSALHWRRQPPNVAGDSYVSIPFRPAVTYDHWNVSIRNTEQEPYLNTSLILYVEGTRYSMPVGTIRPGETVTRSLLSLTNEHGESFKPNPLQISELEVRANFRGYEAHKDFPPPK